MGNVIDIVMRMFIGNVSGIVMMMVIRIVIGIIAVWWIHVQVIVGIWLGVIGIIIVILCLFMSIMIRLHSIYCRRIFIIVTVIIFVPPFVNMR